MLRRMLKLFFPKMFKEQTITIITKPLNEHNPKAQSTVYPETQSDFNEVQMNLHQQIKKQYDAKRSN